MSESVKIKIGDVDYRIQEWLATERDEFLFELNDMFGEWLTVLVENYFADTDKLAEISVTGILRSVFQRGSATPTEKAAFIKKLILASVKTPMTATESYDIHWTKHYARRPALIKAIFELNFGSMILELKKKLRESGVFTPKSSPEQEPEMKAEDLKEKPKKAFPEVNFSNGR